MLFIRVFDVQRFLNVCLFRWLQFGQARFLSRPLIDASTSDRKRKRNHWNALRLIAAAPYDFWTQNSDGRLG